MRNFDAIVESMWDEDYSIWREVDSKPVLDSDGFYTDYTWYSDGDGNHIFIFGDKDIYEPDPSWADWEISGDYSEAEEWFANYQGFADDLEESLKEGYNVGDIFSDPHTYELYKNGQGAKWKISNIDDQGIHMTPVNKAAENVLQDVGPMTPLSAKELDEIINKGNLIKESLKRKINESDEGVHHYVFCFGDGNSAASRGTEEENLCQISGDIKDTEAAVVISILNDLPENFNSEILRDTFNEVYGEDADEAFEEYSELSPEQIISDLDISGGDPLVYLVERDGENVFHDADMEEYLLDGLDGDEDWDDDFDESLKRK